MFFCSWHFLLLFELYELLLKYDYKLKRESIIWGETMLGEALAHNSNT